MKNLADCRFANGLTCETYREKILKMSTFKIIPTKFYPEDLRISGILKTKPQILRFRFEDLGYSDVTSTFEDLRIRGFFRCMFRVRVRGWWKSSEWGRWGACAPCPFIFYQPLVRRAKPLLDCKAYVRKTSDMI